jgi:mycofactocin system glycosyltransferase
MVAGFEAVRGSLDLGPVAARIAPGSRVGYVPAATIVCRVAALREVGGFDEELRFGEDVDLVWRLQAAGWRCRYEPTSVVTHRARASFAGWMKQRFQYGRSAGALARRHPGALAPLRVSGWSAAVWALVALRRPAAAAALAAATAVALQRKLRDVPPAESARLTGLGHLYAGEQIARATTRAWFPAAIVVALGIRRWRPALVAAVLVPPVLTWVRLRRKGKGHRSPRAFATFLAMHVADDVAYCAGLWDGARAARTLGPLLPDLRDWPPRRAPRPVDRSRRPSHRARSGS